MVAAVDFKSSARQTEASSSGSVMNVYRVWIKSRTPNVCPQGTINPLHTLKYLKLIHIPYWPCTCITLLTVLSTTNVAENPRLRTADDENPDEEEIWKLIHAAGDQKTDIAPIIDQLTSNAASSTSSAASDVVVEAPAEAVGQKAEDIGVDREATASTASASEGSLSGSTGTTEASVEMMRLKAPMHIRQSAFHPTKGGNANHSGYSPYLGVSDLSFPSWTFLHPEAGIFFSCLT